MENNNAFFEKKTSELPPLMLDGRDGIFGILFLVLSVLSVDFGLFGGFRLGFSVSVIGMGIALFCYFLKNGKIRPYGFFCNVSAMLISASYGVFDSGWTKFAGFIAICLLFSLCILSYGEIPDIGDWRKAADVFSALIFTPFSRMTDMLKAVVSKIAGKGENGKKTTAILVGALAAIPAVCIVIPLLMSSDAAFDGLMSMTVFSDIPRVIGSVILGALLFLYIFSGVLAFAKKRSVSSVPQTPYPVRDGINHYGISAFLGVICVVYCVYLLSQLGYFFGAFSSLLPEDFTVAEYARRGFFEMVVVCVINLLLIAVSAFGAQREEGKIFSVIRIPCIFLCAFSVFLCATVCAKLVLYMSRFGLTRLRLYTTAFSVLIVVVFILLCIYLFAEGFPYFKILTVFATVLMLILAWVDVDTLVARYNVYAFENGLTAGIDLYTLSECGDPGTEALIGLLDYTEGSVATEAAEELLIKYSEFGANASAEKWWEYENATLEGELVVKEKTDFREYTLAHERAKRAYCGAWQKICGLLNK